MQFKISAKLYKDPEVNANHTRVKLQVFDTSTHKSALVTIYCFEESIMNRAWDLKKDATVLIIGRLAWSYDKKREHPEKMDFIAKSIEPI